MSTSYPRNCRYCGQRIHMRKMPHGRWVAFDFDNQPHDCRSAKSSSKATNTSRPAPPSYAAEANKKNQPVFDDISFHDFAHLQGAARMPQAVAPVNPTPVKPLPPYQQPRASSPPVSPPSQPAQRPSVPSPPVTEPPPPQKASKGCALIPLLLLLFVVAIGSLLGSAR